MNKKLKQISFYVVLVILILVKSNLSFSNYDNFERYDNLQSVKNNYEENIYNNDALIIDTVTQLIKEVSNNLKYNKNYIDFITQTYGENSLGVKFVTEYYKYSKNYGEIKNITAFFYQNNENQYETRLFIYFEKGNLTINFLHKDIMNKLINLYDVEDNEMMFFMDISLINDFYISKGINNKQVIGMKYFKSNLLFFILILFIAITLIYLYKKKTKVIADKKVMVDNKDYDDLEFVIAAALNQYLSDDNKYEKINIKTIKKVNW